MGRKGGGHDKVPSGEFEAIIAGRSAASLAAAVAVAIRAAVIRFVGDTPLVTAGRGAERVAASATGAAFCRGIFRSLPASRGSLNTTCTPRGQRLKPDRWHVDAGQLHVLKVSIATR